MTADVTTQPRRAAQASQKRKFIIEAIAVAAIALTLVIVLPLFLTPFASIC